ncbi:hypothetical protein D3C73_1440880 [compost metagenome]
MSSMQSKDAKTAYHTTIRRQHAPLILERRGVPADVSPVLLFIRQGDLFITGNYNYFFIWINYAGSWG